MYSEHEMLHAANIVILQRASQQLLPPPYETMCSQDIGSRVDCLDRCLSRFQTKGRFVKFVNSSMFTKNDAIE